MYDPDKAHKIAETGRGLIKVLLRKQKINKILNGRTKNIFNTSK